ncbi:MAG TPA: pyruvate kinase [Candidatus Mediterraneibacter norwichensis]|nr:pyruvate kinase [Candidatus Mediterraneibacter norwichensis]
MRKTKIICTLGPATDKEGIMEALIREGMNVARFNFSHGTHEEQKNRLEKLKTLRRQFDRPIAALLDTKGPEIRIGCFKDHRITLEEGQKFTLVNDETEGTQEQVTISYKDLYKDVKPGDSILIDDGLVGMEVVEISDKDIVCIVKNGGDISDHKGVNVPGVELKMPFISQKDREDLLFGIQEDFDFVAASFTRTADDVKEMRKLLNDNGGRDIHIIAKIENQQGVDNIDAIIEEADGIMIARGDMGVEIPLEHVPIIQQKIIEKVYEAGKVVITATQMLDSMMIHPRPTRAETTDVANAIYQGTSAIMLSGETAAGKYPVEALKMMVKIAAHMERNIEYNGIFRRRERSEDPDITNAISHATCMTAIDLKANAILAVSKTGNTARMISKYRPECLIVGCSSSEKVYRQLNLSWGILPLQIREEYSSEILCLRAIEAAQAHGIVGDGDKVVFTGGIPLGIPGRTNLIRVCIVGE